MILLLGFVQHEIVRKVCLLLESLEWTEFTLLDISYIKKHYNITMVKESHLLS